MADCCEGTSRGVLYVREHMSFDLAGDAGQVDAQPAKDPLLAQGAASVCACASCNYFSIHVCMFVWGDGVIRNGWRVEGLSEVIFPSHLIIGCLADSLDGSTA